MTTQGEVRQDPPQQSLDTYREDGNDDPHGAEHSVIYCLTSFQWVLDALIIAVKPSVVRLDGACLDDKERKARWSRWNHSIYQEREKKRKGKTSVPKRNLKQRPSQISLRVLIFPSICRDLQPRESFCYAHRCSSFPHPYEERGIILFSSPGAWR